MTITAVQRAVAERLYGTTYTSSHVSFVSSVTAGHQIVAAAMSGRWVDWCHNLD